MKTVYVVGGDTLVGLMFGAQGWNVTVGPPAAVALLAEVGAIDLICFTGGADVSPELYGEKNEGQSFCNPSRDRIEEKIYKNFVGDIPMVGICRGGQFLHVMNGGKLIQHLGATRSGYIKVHKLLEGSGSELLPVPVHVDHHQGIVFPDPEMRGCATLLFDEAFEGEEIVCAAYYEKTKSLCFQPHPEWGHVETHNLFFKLLKEYIG